MASVYVFQHGNKSLFKIGRTRGDVGRRRRELSTGNPVELKLFHELETDHDAMVENFLHRKLASCRSRRSDAKEFYEIAPADLRTVLDEAVEFLNEYIPLLESSEELKARRSNGQVLQANRAARALHQQLHEVSSKITDLEFEQEILESRLKNLIGDADEISGIASWRSQVSQRLDSARLRKEEPALYAEYCVKSMCRVFRLQ